MCVCDKLNNLLKTQIYYIFFLWKLIVLGRFLCTFGILLLLFVAKILRTLPALVHFSVPSSHTRFFQNPLLKHSLMAMHFYRIPCQSTDHVTGKLSWWFSCAAPFRLNIVYTKPSHLPFLDAVTSKNSYYLQAKLLCLIAWSKRQTSVLRYIFWNSV